jgi:hypothetical protein
MKRIPTALAVLMLAVTAHAATHYVAQTAGVFSGGSACNGQTAVTPTTWNGTTIATADPTYLCGPLTTSAGGTILVPHNGGTSGNPIQIVFDTGASLQAPYFSTSGAINLGSLSYVTVNGGTNGFIQNTLNGSSGATCPGGACSYQQSTEGIYTVGGNVTIENLGIYNLYVHISSDSSIDQTTLNAIHFAGANDVFTGNTIHDVGWALYNVYGAGDSATVSNNTIYNIDHGWALTTYGSVVSAGPFVFHDNTVYGYAAWDTPGGDYHHDGLHCYTSGTGGTPAHISSLQIYNNKWGTIGSVGVSITAHVFLEGGGGSGATPCDDSTSANYIYNNVFVADQPSNNGLPGLFSGHNYVFNNTIISTAGTGSGLCYASNSDISAVDFRNNAVTGCNQLVAITTPFTPNYNTYGNGGSNAFVCGSNYYNASQFSSWQSCVAGDANSSYNSTLSLNTNGSPQSGSPVINAGTNLTSLGITPLNSDINGNARPSSGAWTGGAYNSSGGPPQASTPTFSPVAGTYSSTQSVTISASTGGVICYNTTGSPATNGTTGCTTGTHYTAPVSVSATETLYAVAGGTGYSDSSVGSAAYTITTPTASAPTFSPVAGAVTNPTTVTASTSTSGCGSYIYFDTNSTPTTHQTTYSVTTAVTLHAYVHGCPSYADSSISSAAYTITAAATPSFSPAAGAVANPTTVTASTATSDGCTMYLDTSNPPTTAQSTYSVTTPVTLRAQAKGCTHYANSAVGSAAYTISGGTTLTITTVSLPSGTVGTAYSFTMSATGGTPPYTWSDPSCTGACNTGLSFSTAGVWYGSPLNAGSSTFTIQVADAASHTASGPFVLTIATPPAAGASPLLLMAMALNCNCAHQPNPVLEWMLSPPGTAQSTWTQTLLVAKIASLTTSCPVAGNSAYKSAASLAGNATSWTDSTETPGTIICTIDEESYVSGGKTVVSYSLPSGPFQVPVAL